MTKRERAGSFEAAGDLRAGRTWHTATELADGKVLVLGGRGFRNKPDVAAELWDPVAGRFEPGPPPPSPRQLHSATLLQDGRVLIAGGKGQRDVTEQTAVVQIGRAHV